VQSGNPKNGGELGNGGTVEQVIARVKSNDKCHESNDSKRAKDLPPKLKKRLGSDDRHMSGLGKKT